VNPLITHVRGWQLLACLVMLILVTTAATADGEFPGRAIYPEVSVIDLDSLQKQLAAVVVVDVRSAYEHRTLRIKNAINIPVAGKDFVEEVQKLRANTDKPIVFYCNGKTCMKSYKAAQKASLAGIKEVQAYDAGIMDWARAFPKQSLLLGQPLNDPQLLISKERFKKHLLEPEDFANKVASGKYIVLDVRDRFQRDALALFPGRERRAYLDQTKKLDRQIRRAKKRKRAMLIYDAAGKQVRWLQYYLEYKRVPRYFFMKGGARAYYSDITDAFLGKP
jgi:rhodanese-related sulfurtransferase